MIDFRIVLTKTILFYPNLTIMAIGPYQSALQPCPPAGENAQRCHRQHCEEQRRVAWGGVGVGANPWCVFTKSD